MAILRAFVMIVLLAPVAVVHVAAQSLGSFELQARPKISGKQERITRKRFYLFAGGLAANKPLIDRLKASNATSRDCFYCQMKASAEYMAWLKEKDCESPYCRAITKDDVAKVPEFQVAYNKGLGPRQFAGKTNVALTWLTSNLAPNLRDGFYRQRKSLIDTLLTGLKPVQTAMTDSSKSSVALFVDIPLKPPVPGGKASETFLFSNLVPVEIGGKGYVWACEIEIGPTKRAVASLKVPEGNKPVSKCEVIVKDLSVCEGGICVQK
ncbi:MAG: hypothetical protein ABR530_07440 [Pyrinomonadaceae bacterium]